MSRQVIIESLQVKLDEQKLLLRTLAMWDKVKDQGISPDEVASFGFDPSLVGIAERRKLQFEFPRASKSNPYGWAVTRNAEGQARIVPEKYNFVHLHNGNKTQLSPMIDAP